MQGLMQYQPLLLTAFLEHAATNHARVPIVSWNSNRLFRYTYGEAAARARRLASSLQRLGFGLGDFVGSLAWTTNRHFELMYAVPGIGATLHTANPRLADSHIIYTINHTGERVLFVDPDCLEQVEAIAERLTAVDTFVIMADRSEAKPTRLSNVLYYEDLVADGDERFSWPEFDERTASTLCFTSGTTGDPKGILYSHRGTYLSAMAIAPASAWGVSDDDAIIVLAAFFHCNGWGAPYLGPMAGAKLILPGRALDGRSLQKLIADEGATVGPGVPTIWLGIAEYCRATGAKLGRLNRIVCGGAAPPLALMRTYWQEFGVRTVQAWGMTETTHAATIQWTEKQVLDGVAEPSAPQGKPVFGTMIRIVDDEGRPVPKDGNAVGHLRVKANWCASGYLKRDDASVLDREGWLQTGDLAAITPDNALRIADRAKDVIKSGGEWISSIDLENAAISHPAVIEAAVIGVPHPRWQERPVLYVVAKSEGDVSAGALLAHLSGLVAKWWLPDEIFFVPELPHNATGKVRKDVLRTWYGDRVK